MNLSTTPKIIKSINPLVIVIAVFLVYTYLLFTDPQNIVPAADNPKIGEPSDKVKSSYVIMIVVVAVLAFLLREKKLITINEAIEEAFSDAKQMKRKGLLREEGRLLPILDGIARKINGEIDSIAVAIAIEGSDPQLIVYDFSPYLPVYNLRRTVMSYWDARRDPDLKVIVPPDWVSFLEQRKRLMGSEDES